MYILPDVVFKHSRKVELFLKVVHIMFGKDRAEVGISLKMISVKFDLAEKKLIDSKCANET
jgi:hypothetical protein